MDVSVILPTYNECDNIADLIDALADSLEPFGWQSEIVVVDDNSPDGTAAVVETCCHKREDVSVRCLVRTSERGLATAIKHGILNSTGESIVVMDTDFNHDPLIIPRMVQLLAYYELVIGSRYVVGGGMEDGKRYIYSLIYNTFVKIVLWHKIQDNLSGFFAMRRSALAPLDLATIFRGYGEYFIRLNYAALHHNYTVLEIPVFYKLRPHGSSKSNFTKMIRDYTLCAFQTRFGKSI
jgi:dolichol-phosphate mannosyltransferase